MKPDVLKPTPQEIRRLALAETTPESYRRFVPISAGALATVLLIGIIGVLSIPAIIIRALLRGRT